VNHFWGNRRLSRGWSKGRGKNGGIFPRGACRKASVGRNKKIDRFDRKIVDKFQGRIGITDSLQTVFSPNFSMLSGGGKGIRTFHLSLISFRKLHKMTGNGRGMGGGTHAPHRLIHQHRIPRTNSCSFPSKPIWTALRHPSQFESLITRCFLTPPYPIRLLSPPLGHHLSWYPALHRLSIHLPSFPHPSAFFFLIMPRISPSIFSCSRQMERKMVSIGQEWAM
jgi:hypothetical protein